MGDEQLLALVREITYLARSIVGLLDDHGSDRYLEPKMLAALAGPSGSLAVGATTGAILRMKAVSNERIEVRTRDQEDRSASPAVAAVGSASRHELLAPEAQTSSTTVAGCESDVDFVDEHG